MTKPSRSGPASLLLGGLRRIGRGLSPHFFVQLNDARRKLGTVSGHPWLDACFSDKLQAIESARYSILPAACKRSPSFVIDVGANEGQWLSSLLKLVPISEVWVFEPNPDAMKICQRRLGNSPAIRYFGVALGDVSGSIDLHITDSSDFSSVLQPRAEFITAHYGTGGATIAATKQVPLRTLDSLVPESRSVDLLKIDVQGFERAVLSGARRVLARTRAVLIEANLHSHYTGDDTFPNLWNELAAQGFSFWSLSQPHIGHDGKALWADAVFVKADGMGNRSDQAISASQPGA